MVLALANEQSAVLFTTDADFGELVFRLGRAHQGVVLVRLEGLSEDRKQVLVLDALARHGQEMAGAFTVITASLVRIRPGR
jgi:predicted nuclease of predicted toxin-antitoxin system